jgi:hypothetical protein
LHSADHNRFSFIGGLIQKPSRLFLRFHFERPTPHLSSIVPPTKRRALEEVKNGTGTANAPAATGKKTDTKISSLDNVRLYRRGFRMASLLSILVVLLCQRF